MTEEMLAAWYTLNAAAARLQRTPASKLTAALEELESARLEPRALVEASLSKPPAENYEKAQIRVGIRRWSVILSRSN